MKIEEMSDLEGKYSLRIQNQEMNYVIVPIDSLKEKIKESIENVISQDMINRHKILFLVEESQAPTLSTKTLDFWLSSLNDKMYLGLDENNQKVIDTGLLINDNLTYGRTSSNDLLFVESQNNMWKTYKYKDDNFNELMLYLKPVITIENNTIYTLSTIGSSPILLNLTKTN